jgi:hypothetical protein
MESASGQHPHVPARKTQAKKSQKRFFLVLAGVLVAVVVAVLSGWLLYRSSTAATIDSNKYQAVFFTNGQVYFGKLDQVNANYFKLTDVFYIQAQEADAKTDSENPQKTGNESTDIRLIKLGSEVHGPDDEMIISKDQILFFENLKKDGKVSDSITKYNAEKK